MLKIQVNNKQNVFFTSDTHFNHAGIVRGTSTWEGKRGCRDFDTLEAHDNYIVRAINKVVGVDDILFHLGDFSFGSYKNRDNVENVKVFRQRINCKTIHLIEGNHDNEISKNVDGLQELFTSFQPYLEVEISENSVLQGVKAFKQKIVLCHYAMRVWNWSHHGSWMLYGHSHGTLDAFTPFTANPQWIGDQYFIKNIKTMDVGIDNHPKLRPFSFHTLKEIMDINDVTLNIDHHEGSSSR